MAAPRSHNAATRPKKVANKRRSKRRTQHRRAWAILLIPLFLFLILSLLLIWQRVTVEQLANDIAILEVRQNQLEEQNARLLARAEQLSDYGRISKIATERLGMIKIAPTLIVASQE